MTGVVGRQNPNADDGMTPTGVTDDTKPAKGVQEISCYLRVSALLIPRAAIKQKYLIIFYVSALLECLTKWPPLVHHNCNRRPQMQALILSAARC